MNRSFLFGILAGASAALSSSFLMGRQAFLQTSASAMAASFLSRGEKQIKSNNANAEKGDNNQPSLKSYYHLMVNEKGETSIIKRDFANTETVGYSNTPQVIKKLDPKFASPSNIIFTALEGENPWHYCPTPQIVVCLRGGWYIQTNNGEITKFRPGDALYQDNIEQHPGAANNNTAMEHPGQHYSGSLDGKPCDQMIVQLDLIHGPKTTKPDDPPPL